MGLHGYYTQFVNNTTHVMHAHLGLATRYDTTTTMRLMTIAGTPEHEWMKHSMSLVLDVVPTTSNEYYIHKLYLEAAYYPRRYILQNNIVLLLCDEYSSFRSNIYRHFNIGLFVMGTLLLAFQWRRGVSPFPWWKLLGLDNPDCLLIMQHIL